MSEVFKKYPEHSSYEIGNNGTVKYNGKEIRNTINKADVFINGSKISVDFLVYVTFQAIVEPVKQIIPKQEKQPSKWVHRNTGKKHTEATKQAISKANRKQVVIEGVTYKSITEASEQLNVNRSTIYRINRKALPS